MRQQQLAEASSALTRAVELGEWDDAVFGLMGFCHLGLERYASALNAYNNAILLAPENADWKLGIIKSQVGIGNFKEALSMLNELIAKSPDNSKLWELQAGVFVQNNDLDKAVINYELLREIKENSLTPKPCFPSCVKSVAKLRLKNSNYFVWSRK